VTLAVSDVERAARTAPQMLLQCDRLLRFFHDFLKAPVSSQWIPKGQKFQLTVADRAWTADDNGKLFAGEIFVTNPRGDHRQILIMRLRARCEFLEARITPERIEHWIEPEQRGSERCAHPQCTPVGDREQLL
jgi:hypothetical protein